MDIRRVTLNFYSMLTRMLFRANAFSSSLIGGSDVLAYTFGKTSYIWLRSGRQGLRAGAEGRGLRAGD